MVLTSFPTDQGKGAVRIRITADTVCQGQDVYKGEELVVPYGEYLKLKHSNKAEVVAEPATAETKPQDPGLTEEELRVALDAKTKAQIVAGAKELLGLDLNENDTKSALIDAVVAAEKAKA